MMLLGNECSKKRPSQKKSSSFLSIGRINQRYPLFSKSFHPSSSMLKNQEPEKKKSLVALFMSAPRIQGVSSVFYKFTDGRDILQCTDAMRRIFHNFLGQILTCLISIMVTILPC